jgi:hypothetical protein
VLGAHESATVYTGAQAQVQPGQTPGLFKKVLRSGNVHHRQRVAGCAHRARHPHRLELHAPLQLNRVAWQPGTRAGVEEHRVGGKNVQPVGGVTGQGNQVGADLRHL